MFTTCPECGTVFRVTTAQLRMAEGFVRCGHCAAEFNAIASLSDELPAPAAPPPAASGWTGRYPAATGTFAAPAAAAVPAAALPGAPAAEPASDDGAAWRDGWAGRGGAPAPAPDEGAEADDAPVEATDDDAADDLDDGLVAGLDVALPTGDDADDDEPGGVYVIEGETPEWTARGEAEEPVLARAVAPVFGTPAAPALAPAAEDAAGTRDAAPSGDDDAASGDEGEDEDEAADDAAWDAGDVEAEDEDDAGDDEADDADDDEEPGADTDTDDDDDDDHDDAIVLTAEAEAEADSDGDIDWEALLGEVDDDEPAAPVYVVEGDAPPMARDLVDPAGDDAELDAALEAMDAEVGVADATVMATALAADDDLTAAPAADATPDDADSTADFPVLRIPPEFRRDLAASLPADDSDGDDSATDAAPATGPAETGSSPPGSDDSDAADPVVLLADEPPRAATADDDWPRFDPANPPWDPPPESRPAERRASVAELPPLWQDRPAWPPAAEEPARRSWPWAVGSLVLALALGAQVLIQQRDELATHPEYGPRIRAAFEAVGLSVYPAWNLSAYTVRGSEAVAGRTAPGALDVIANIAITGNEPVGLPIIRVTLRDRWNEAIGTRAFSARDYLDPASTLRDPLPPGTLIPVRVRIADPGNDAFGYEVDVCLMDRRTGLTCQAGREPFRP
jgi:predicted Zn finger-like uncharacterized protein